MLIENGANINTIGVFQKTILMYSANKGKNWISAQIFQSPSLVLFMQFLQFNQISVVKVFEVR